MTEKKPIRFGDLLAARAEREEREREEASRVKPALEQAPLTSANSAPDVEFAPDADSASGAGCTPEPVQLAPDADSAPLPSPHRNKPPRTGADISPSAKSAPHAPLLSVEAHAGYTRIPNTILDGLASRLEGADFKVYLRLYRLTAGFDRQVCTIGYEKLAEKCGISRRTAIHAIHHLVGLGLIQHDSTDFGGPKEVRGNTYRVFLPTVIGAQPASGAISAPEAKTAPGAIVSPMKEILKKSIKSPLYQIREIGAQLREQHRGDGTYSRADLRADVKQRCAGEGIAYDDALIEEALGKVGL